MRSHTKYIYAPRPSPPCLFSYLLVFLLGVQPTSSCFGIGVLLLLVFSTLTELFGVAYCMPRVFDMS